MGIRISECFLKFFIGIRISECFLKFFMGFRISKCFLDFFNGDQNFWMFLGVFYGDQNFFIPAWVFGGIRSNESYNKKVPKNFVGNLRCLTEYKKAMSKSRKLHKLPILFVTNCLYLSQQQNRSVCNGYFTQNLSKSEWHILVWNLFCMILEK